MEPREEFVQQVADAYEHLYDLVYLRAHPLATVLVPAAHTLPKRRARELHDLLRDLIDELDPGPEAPPFSAEWRRHRYMVLRYLKGLTHQAVADQFGVGLRQYYRLREGILDEVAAILWERRAQPAAGRDSPQERASANRLGLLRLEAARLAQAERYAHVGETVKGVLSLLRAVMQQRDVHVEVAFPEPLPPASIQQDLLRQALVGIMGYLLERCENTNLQLTAQIDEPSDRLSLRMQLSEATTVAPVEGADGGPQSELQQIAALADCHILPLHDDQRTVGYELQLPIAHQTVLVIDDNQDVIQLFQRFLSPHGYRVATAQTAGDALDKACRLQPYAITLDLMIPERDGWEVLQLLTSQPETREIPVIVCTVLRQRDLALSLGATAYLEKPVTEQSLISALAALQYD